MTLYADLSETDWAYIAGMVDADGYISIMQNGPRMGVTNQCVPLIVWLQESLGGNENGSQGTGFGSTRKTKQWNIGANGMRYVLPKLIPYLRVKKDRALLLVEYLGLPRGKNDRKEEIFHLVRSLNAGANGKGKSIHNIEGEE